MKKKQTIQSRNWCFTDFQILDLKTIYEEYKDIIRYICWGIEICPKTKKKHLQGWIQFINKKRMGGVKRIFGCKKLHLETCRASPKLNDIYCKKENNFFSFGQYVCQGQRTDLEKIYKDISKGAKVSDIIENNFETYCRYRNGIRDAVEIHTKILTKEFREIDVLYVHGKTNTGKTRTAVKAFKGEDYYKIEGSSLNWFDGYNGEKNLIIDEYDNDVKITKMLNLLDGYQLRLPIKGGFTYANWDCVIITSNLTPDELHSNAKKNHREALFRRIDKIHHMN